MTSGQEILKVFISRMDLISQGIPERQVCTLTTQELREELVSSSWTFSWMFLDSLLSWYLEFVPRLV